MKLMLVVDAFGGGAGNVMQILAREFNDHGHKVSLVLLNGKIVEPKYDLSGVKIYDYPLGKYAHGKTPVDKVYKSVRFIRKLILDIKPDCIISFLSELNTLCCMANHSLGKKKVPIIISERNDPSKEKLKGYWEFLRNHTYKYADKIVVQCSNFRSLCNGKFDQKVSIIANPILQPVEKKVHCEHDKIVAVSLGRLNKQKNFFWLIDRFERLKSECPNLQLRIYGSGNQENELHAYIEKLDLGDAVSLMGYAAEPHKILSDADIYLMSSDYEGFPNALSEAMAVGLPSVSRLCHEGLRDLVNDGENGYLLNPNDTYGFENAVIELASNFNTRKRMGENAMLTVKKFGVDEVVALSEANIIELVTGQVHHGENKDTRR